MDNSSIKGNIEFYRNLKNLSQTEMALRTDMTRNAYRSLEKGGTVLLHEKLPRIASALGISTEQLVLGYEPRPLSEGELRSSENHAEQIHALTEDYENRLSKLQADVDVRDTCIKSLEENIEHLKSIISRQEKELSGK